MFNGLKRGLQLMADALSLTRRHVLTVGAVLHPDVIKDFAAMYDVWIKELTALIANPSGLIFGGDPFQGSRMILHELEAKYDASQVLKSTPTPGTALAGILSSQQTPPNQDPTSVDTPSPVTESIATEQEQQAVPYRFPEENAFDR